MPSLANITVKKYDGTTDITYSGVLPSPGDKSPAMWRSLTIGTAQAHKPELLIAGAWNGPRTARRLSGKFMYPSITVGGDGKVYVQDRCLGTFEFVLPQNMPDIDANEAGAQFCNLMSSALVKEMVRTGYAAT